MTQTLSHDISGNDSGDSGDSSFAYAKEYKNRTVYFLSFFRGNIYDP